MQEEQRIIMVTSHDFSSLSLGHLLIHCALKNKMATTFFLIILLFSDYRSSASTSWVCWMTTARLTLLSSCWMSLNVFLMVFYSWCGDVTWLSLGDSISIRFCLPWKITRQSTAPAGRSFWRWHPLDSSAVTPKHPLGAVQSIFWSDSSSLGGGLLTTQCRIDFSKELVEITGSKGRSQGDTLPFIPPSA